MMIIRRAQEADASRLAEIEVFNYRLNFYPIFKNDAYYFGELNVPAETRFYLDNPEALKSTYVYDDGVVKGFVRMDGAEVKKLFVEPALHGRSIGAELLEYAVAKLGASFLWALEKNERALKFYERHGFSPTGERKPEEETSELLLKLERRKK